MEKDFIPATNDMLQQAADGELVLFAPARRHTAKLHAFTWAVAPKQSNRSCAAGLVPIAPTLAKELLCFSTAKLESYLAVDPTDCPPSHPWKDHYWVLDEPQTITREQIYFQPAPAAVSEDVGDAKAMQLLYGATEHTGDRPWLKYDSWDAELACKLILFNYPVDMNGKGWDAVANWPIDKWGRKASIALRHHFDRALCIAKSSVQAGTIKEHDTSANWIEWAEGKGYSVAHLMPADAPTAKVETKQRSITKQQVINAFDGLHFDCDQWSKALSNVPKWLEPCRVSRGRKGDKSTSATWNPVQIAAALYGDEGKGITIKKLDAVFVRLKDWADEWHEVSESFTD